MVIMFMYNEIAALFIPIMKGYSPYVWRPVGGNHKPATFNTSSTPKKSLVRIAHELQRPIKNRG
jgi:hypothetical protein